MGAVAEGVDCVELNGDCGHIATGCEATPKIAAALAQALR
jgi:hypothetical protein